MHWFARVAHMDEAGRRAVWVKWDAGWSLPLTIALLAAAVILFVSGTRPVVALGCLVVGLALAGWNVVRLRALVGRQTRARRSPDR